MESPHFMQYFIALVFVLQLEHIVAVASKDMPHFLQNITSSL